MQESYSAGMPILRFTICAILISSLMWVSTAVGQEQRDADKARSAEFFRKGEKLFAGGEYVEAAFAFERAYQLFPHPSSLANMGFCYDEIGDYERAVTAFRKYMKQPNPQTPEDTVKISRYLERMKSKVGDLAIKCSLRTCEVTVDQAPRGVTPTNIVLLAGTHSVTVASVGEEVSRHYTVTVPGGGQVVLEADLNALPPVPSGGTIFDDENDAHRLRAPFWIATAATAAGLGTIGVLVGLNYQTREEFREGGSTSTELEDRGNRLTLGTNIAIGATIAAAGAAIVLAIIDIKKFRNQKSENSSRNQSFYRFRRSRFAFSGNALVLSFGITTDRPR